MIHSLSKAAAAVTVALLVAACAALPAGVSRAPADDPGAGLLSLPSGRVLPVLPERLRYTGQARLEWPDGRVYTGSWQDGKPDGEGTETRPDSTRYRGGWQQGLRHGFGVLEDPRGNRYVGEFHQGTRHGNGRSTGPDGDYRGQWLADVPHGHGIYEAADGTRYDGQWQLGRRSGYGRLAASDGGSYEGDWSADQPHGFGRMESPDGQSYDGAWHSGRRHGYGRAEGPPGLVYEGTWAENRKQGFGREQRPDGSSYLGQWQAGKRHGQGLELRPDGAFHDGTWELNQALGPGQRREPSGIEISGSWNGDQISTGLLKLPTGAEFAGPLYRLPDQQMTSRLWRWLSALAGRGDPYAQLLLGTSVLDGRAPRQEAERGSSRARQWLTGAAASGIPEAQFRLALTYESVHPPRVVELLAEAGAQGHARANETLGEYYYRGHTVPQNFSRAIAYFERAADAGSFSARNNLAWLLATASDPQHRDGRRAVDVIRPIALYTGHWQYLDTLAAAWAAAGDFEQAIAAARQAVDTASRQPGGASADDLTGLERRLAGYRRGEAYVEAP